MSNKECERLVKELRKLAESWRNAPVDPYNIANAVMVSLHEVANAIERTKENSSDSDL